MASGMERLLYFDLLQQKLIQVDSAYFQNITDQMAEWYGASASGSVDLGFDSKSDQTNHFKIGIHSFPA